MHQEAESGAPPAAAEVRRYRLGVALVWVTLAWTVVPRLLQSLAAPKVRNDVGVQDAVSGNVASSLSLAALTLVLLGLCSFIVLDSLSSPHHTSVFRLMAVLAPWGYMAVRNLFVAETPRVDLFVYTAVIVALWRLRPDQRILVALGYAVGVAAGLAVLMGIVVPGSAVFRTDLGALVTDDKAIGSWGFSQASSATATHWGRCWRSGSRQSSSFPIAPSDCLSWRLSS